MAKRPEKVRKLQINLKELVVVTFAENIEHAKDYESLLKANDIPTMIKGERDNGNGSKGVAVMVPEDYLDEAHVIIESQDAYDDFYDFAFDEEGESDFEKELFDDDF